MSDTEMIVLGGGCFWCTEAIFNLLPGVVRTISGYAGGVHPNPTYAAVSEGATGHAEVCQVEYDPQALPLEKLIEVFFKMHDPTTPNRQGQDIGTQYRSIILFTSEAQKEVVQKVLRRIEGEHRKSIVTELGRLETFYPAEAYHQRYYEKHPNQAYCTFVIKPKVEKLFSKGSKAAP